ncbi:Hydrolase, alpha/beta fold family functionally coupled to Phosphoribulokinase [hydrothermal vent metagenome]|uniref:Hydrolase, alpha/beta fold family functionally coupled to Phosphoribulokinase n=1 Tax=hydrothermal vent metagenome TaxID=652676 RepID=A0A3B1AIU3_9ZZZZ
MPIVRSTFKPAWWLRSAHAQTIWSSFVRRKPRLNIDWQRVELPDGDFIDLAWSGPKQGKTVLLLHGLEGSVSSVYASGLMVELNRRGYRACLMHFRGCSDQPNRLPLWYHSGQSEDPQHILKFLRDQMDIDVYAAVGFSLGGNVLLKWLGEQGAAMPIQRAAVMSVPFRLAHAAQRMDTGFSRLYQWHLVSSMRHKYKNKFTRIASPLDVDISTLDTFWQFDDQITAPLHGFKDVHDYYARASSRPFIPRIRVPTLILHSSDDPFMYSHTPPRSDELPDNVCLELTEHGGHVGFISGRVPGLAHYWGERRLLEWIDN